MSAETYDVAIVGGGPAGLSAAIELKRRGVAKVALLERGAEVGGIPRHCGHPPFGMREFGRILTGQAYARRLAGAAVAAGVTILTKYTVVHTGPDGLLTVASPAGVQTIQAARILIATGARETTRAQLLVPGVRPLGVMNTAALQAFVYQEGRVPFRRPVVVGSELVSLSAILTCRSHGIRPVAMVETEHQVQARPAFFALPRVLGVPVMTGAQVLAIEGSPRVTSVRLRLADGKETVLDCDGLIFSGRFIPEAALAEASALALDLGTGGPVIDQYGRSSDPNIFVAGNMIHPIETAGHCWAEGRRVARVIAAELANARNAEPGRTPGRRIIAGAGLKYVVPQRLTLEGRGTVPALNIRAIGAARGRLILSDGSGTVLRTQSINTAPQKPIRFSLAGLNLAVDSSDLQLRLEPRP
ncbi:NAD(P)/FAD-dependent oxidoreductase [Neorhizobium galegae]|uniref:NAD(P)/FAD-dependent oxidoreductase n=1 Tax=Neorhizobium galegae TaxID=399 RepID=UPI0021015247|nr:FAD-dependent oxidoreductase [Neorhizobium galegae]MCQ1573663.1 NAD(P)/FAD-dependent oxidoreductase [Neorhizobium galegae]